MKDRNSISIDANQLLGFRHVAGFKHGATAHAVDLNRSLNKIGEAPADLSQTDICLDRVFNRIGEIPQPE